MEDNGDASVPQRYKANDGFNLGSWVGIQRQKRDGLTIEQVKKLDDLGFIWNKLEHQWSLGYQHLKQYVEDNGDTSVPQRYKANDGFNLGSWIGTQRLDDKITIGKIEKLNNLGFIWNKLEHQWSLGYQHLKQYVEDNGDTSVPQRYKANDGFNLGSWIGTQRLDDKITIGKIEKLNNLGFIWNKLEHQWSLGYQHLKQYVKDNGNTLVPQSYKINDGFNLGSWVSTQRQAGAGKSKRQLSPEQMQKLVDLGFVWKVEK